MNEVYRSTGAHLPISTISTLSPHLFQFRDFVEIERKLYSNKYLVDFRDNSRLDHHHLALNGVIRGGPKQEKITLIELS